LTGETTAFDNVTGSNFANTVTGIFDNDSDTNPNNNDPMSDPNWCRNQIQIDVLYDPTDCEKAKLEACENSKDPLRKFNLCEQQAKAAFDLCMRECVPLKGNDKFKCEDRCRKIFEKYIGRAFGDPWDILGDSICGRQYRKQVADDECKADFACNQVYEDGRNAVLYDCCESITEEAEAYCNSINCFGLTDTVVGGRPAHPIPDCFKENADIPMTEIRHRQYLCQLARYQAVIKQLACQNEIAKKWCDQHTTILERQRCYDALENIASSSIRCDSQYECLQTADIWLLWKLEGVTPGSPEAQRIIEEWQQMTTECGEKYGCKSGCGDGYGFYNCVGKERKLPTGVQNPPIIFRLP
jgi:hypothetical protein